MSEKHSMLLRQPLSSTLALLSGRGWPEDGGLAHGRARPRAGGPCPRLGGQGVPHPSQPPPRTPAPSALRRGAATPSPGAPGPRRTRGAAPPPEATTRQGPGRERARCVGEGDWSGGRSSPAPRAPARGPDATVGGTTRAELGAGGAPHKLGSSGPGPLMGGGEPGHPVSTARAP